MRFVRLRFEAGVRSEADVWDWGAAKFTIGTGTASKEKVRG